MSITLTINAADNADLREQMLAMLGITFTPAEEAPAPVTPVATRPVSEPKATKPKDEPKAEAPAEESVAEEEIPAADGEKVLNYEDHIKPAVLKVSAKHGRPGVEKLLADFDAANAKEVPEEKWPELLAAIDKLLK